jgi:multiple sugar transport system ATP-binding protein
LQQKPGTLSGGQRQRVAIGRAIVRQPKIFLFDEPLSNLDAALRSEMRIELMRLHKSLGSTMVYVTHDQVEAMTMADKIVVLNAGEIEQIGSPLELYDHPHNRFVAGFIGSPKMNFLPGICKGVDANGVLVDLGAFGRVTLPHQSSDELLGKKVTLGVRPEHLSLREPGFKLSLKPTIVERLGIHSVAYSPMPSGENFIALFEGNPRLIENEPMAAYADPAKCHLFDEHGLAIPRPGSVRTS